MNELVVKKQTPASVEWNKNEFNKLIDEFVDKYKGYDVNEENYKQAKDDLASLRKTKKGANSIAIEVEKSLVEHVTQFRAEVKEALGKIDDVASVIDKGVKKIEEKMLDDRIEEIKSFDGCSEYLEYFKMPDAWLKKRTSNKSINEDIQAGLAEIEKMKKAIIVSCKTHDLVPDEYLGMIKDREVVEIIEIISRDAKMKSETKHNQEIERIKEENSQNEPTTENPQQPAGSESVGFDDDYDKQYSDINKTGGPLFLDGDLSEFVEAILEYDILEDVKNKPLVFERQIHATRQQLTLLKMFIDLVGIDFKEV